jgi:hypothetical protein
MGLSTWGMPLEPVVLLSPIRSSDPGCRGEDLIKPGA